MRKRISDERGQSMVLITLAMVGLIAFLALVIDGGMAFAARRQMQNAADAGALAGGRKLYALYEGSHSAADEQAIYDAVVQYALANGVADPADMEALFINDSQAHTGIALPGNGGIPSDALGVEVTASTSFDSFFARVIGQNELGASALAASLLSAELCGGPYAVWADSYNPTCGLDMTGSFVEVTGSVHSNSDAHLTGSNVNISGAVEYCGDFVGPGAVYDSLDPWPTVWCDPIETYPKPWDGLKIEIDRFAPGGGLAIEAASVSVGVNPRCGGTIGGELQTSCYHYFTGNLKHEDGDDPWLDGLYFVDGNVTVNGNDMPVGAVNITIVATGRIKMTSIDQNTFVAYSNADGEGPSDVLLFSSEPSGCNPWAIDISSSATTWTGIIFAPYGKIDISGSNLTSINGAVWGYTVNLSGSYQSVGWSEDFCSEDVIAPDIFLIR